MHAGSLCTYKEQAQMSFWDTLFNDRIMLRSAKALEWAFHDFEKPNLPAPAYKIAFGYDPKILIIFTFDCNSFNAIAIFWSV